MAIEPSASFTSISAGGLLSVLTNECSISEAYAPASGVALPKIHQFKAIWDTGATGSVITQKVVDDCELKPTGMTQSSGVHGIQKVETYLVNIYLPNKVFFDSMRVIKGSL